MDKNINNNHNACRNTRPHITFYDRPCGSGKTTNILQSFSTDQKYLFVTPLLTEVERVISNACVEFHQPQSGTNQLKSESLEELILEGLNVVTTHSLYASIVHLIRESLLDDYIIIIDEVLDPLSSPNGAKTISWKTFYIDGGYVEIDDDNKVHVTALWDEQHEDVDDTLSLNLYKYAKTGCLYCLDDKFFMLAMPGELLTAGLSVTIYTYQSEGSVLKAYLDRLGIPYVTDTSLQEEAIFRFKARKLITVKTIPSIGKLLFSNSAQVKTAGKKARDARIARSLKVLREYKLKDVPFRNIMITCVKLNWFANGDNVSGKQRTSSYSVNSRLFQANWVANTTRGTNDYSHCSHLIYLYDQHLNPAISRWLKRTDKEFSDHYALTELIQWVWRSRIRKGEPITLYLPSKRMQRIFLDWLNKDFDPKEYVKVQQ